MKPEGVNLNGSDPASCHPPSAILIHIAARRRSDCNDVEVFATQYIRLFTKMRAGIREHDEFE